MPQPAGPSGQGNAGSSKANSSVAASASANGAAGTGSNGRAGQPGSTTAASASTSKASASAKAIPPLMSSDEVNLLVYSYLAESSLDHSAFTLYNESRLADFILDDGNSPAAPPTGHLIRLLQKGLLYLQAEAKYRGEDCTENPPRLIGYHIPDCVPLPPIPRTLPPPPRPESPTVSEASVKQHHQQQQQQQQQTSQHDTEQSDTAPEKERPPNAAKSAPSSKEGARKKAVKDKDKSGGSNAKTEKESTRPNGNTDSHTVTNASNVLPAAEEASSTSVGVGQKRKDVSSTQSAPTGGEGDGNDRTSATGTVISTKKQKLGKERTKSPTAAGPTATTAEASAPGRTGDQTGPSAGNTIKIGKKGKAPKASQVDQQGDTDMQDVSAQATGATATSTTLSDAAVSGGPDQRKSSEGDNVAAGATAAAKGPLARAVAAATTAASKILPASATTAANGDASNPVQQASMSKAGEKPATTTDQQVQPQQSTDAKEPPAASASTQASQRPSLHTNVPGIGNDVRRSSSPQVQRSSAASTAKNRTRSTSPNTTLRNGLSVSTSSSRNASAGASGAAVQTPTLDASGLPSVTQTRKSPTQGKAEQELPKMEAKNVLTKAKNAIKLVGHTSAVQPCHWNPKVDGLLLTGAGDSTARIWEVPAEVTGEPVEARAMRHASGQRRSEITAVEWNSDGSLLATGTDDGIARLWTASGDLHLVLSMHQRTIYTLRWNSKGTLLLTGSLDHSICLWETGYGKLKNQWTSHSDSILNLDWMDDEVFASCSMDKNIHVHHISKNSPVYRFKGHSDEVNCIRFDPSKRLLASCSDDCSVRIWSLRPVKGVLGMANEDDEPAAKAKDDSIKNEDSGDERSAEPMCLVLKGHTREVHAVAWSPDQETWTPGQPRILASASFDATARLWDATTGACLHIINCHGDLVYSLAFQPGKGDYLATGSNDARMCITRVKDRELVHDFTHDGSVYEISWNPTRNQIAVCGKSDIVNVVTFDLD